MTKRDEGYALPFVLVVLLVLVALAVGVMDLSLRNLQSQQNTIQRMQAKYEAAAKIEEVFAAAESKTPTEFPEEPNFLFKIYGRSLRLASAGTTNGDLWIIAEFVPTDTEGGISKTFSQSENVLTIKNNVKIELYKIVDKAAAEKFIAEGTVD